MVRVSKSALKHGIRKREIEHAVEQAIGIFNLDQTSEPRKVLLIGPGYGGNLLEIIGFTQPNGDLIVIHAMKMRKKFNSLLNRKEENDD